MDAETACGTEKCERVITGPSSRLILRVKQFVSVRNWICFVTISDPYIYIVYVCFDLLIEVFPIGFDSNHAQSIRI